MSEKTILEWLQELPEEIREKAIDNYNSPENESWRNKYDRPVASKSEAIQNAFGWSTSPQKYDFWSDWVDKIEVEECDSSFSF